jgi:hypothetical protein
VPPEADKRDNSGSDEEERSRPVSLPAAARPPACLLDQRLQIRDPLLEIAIVLDLRPAGRRCDGHGDSIKMEL